MRVRIPISSRITFSIRFNLEMGLPSKGICFVPLLFWIIFASCTLIVVHSSKGDKYCLSPRKNDTCQCFTVKINSTDRTRVALHCHKVSRPDRLAVDINELNNIGKSAGVVFQILKINFTDVPSESIYNFFGAPLPKHVSLGPLTNITMRDCNLTTLPNESSLQAFLEKHPSVVELDIGGNNLVGLGDRVNFPFGNLTKLTIDNNKWDCDQSSWLIDAEDENPVLFDRKEETRCESPPKYNGLSFFGVRLYQKYEICRTCRCFAVKEAIAVNCSGRGLTTIPEMLPLDTKIVHLDGNEITNITLPPPPSNWASVLKLYLNNNSIGSFELKVKSYSNLRTLHLQQNRLEEIPVHILEQLKHMDVLRLGDNPWLCACPVTIRFQDWIEKNFASLDIDDIRCAKKPSDHARSGIASSSRSEEFNFAGQVIYKIPKSSLCPQPREPIEYLDVISAALATLTLLIIAKLTYDWRWQKRTGKLPRFFKINI